ncbi:MAG: DUF6602 domain-containing protein [Candidatus Promineifilaceae bacterium]|jgi:hypothetical protein
MEIGHSQFIKYCETAASEFEERLKRMQSLVDYKLRSGTGFAEMLRAFLDDYSAGKYHVGEGFIVNPFVSGVSSNHCDILVYDQIQYPLLNVEGDVKVVLPRAAAMVIEVEPYLDVNRLERSMENIHAARKVYPYLVGVIYAFNGLEPAVLYQSMQERASSWHQSTAPIAIINMENGFIAHRAKMSLQSGGSDSPYEVFEIKGNAPSKSLEFLFFLYFDLQMRGMLASETLAKAWKCHKSAAKANFLGNIDLPK